MTIILCRLKEKSWPSVYQILADVTRKISENVKRRRMEKKLAPRREEGRDNKRRLKGGEWAGKPDLTVNRGGLLRNKEKSDEIFANFQ
jgi:hypothetical protein